MNIFVGNLPFRAAESELQAAFEQFGAVSSARIITDRETGRSRGFGFVEMPNDSEANAAIKALDGSDFGDRQMRVNEAQPRQGGGGGGRSGGSRSGSYSRYND
ncbi:MAG: hypothetical protein AMXMBFR84_50340 [Candidatus Hydrogenedentota bacterium]